MVTHLPCPREREEKPTCGTVEIARQLVKDPSPEIWERIYAHTMDPEALAHTPVSSQKFLTQAIVTVVVKPTITPVQV